MAGMALDQKDSSIEGHEALPDSASLRWGVSRKAEFCVTLEREHWNWQVCYSQ